MRNFYLLFAFLILIVIPLSAGGSQEPESIEAQHVQDLVEEFRNSAASEDPGISAAGYYNLGTSQAILADQAEDTGEKERLLKDAFSSLKRAVELGALPPDVQFNARKNLEVVNSRLKQLQEQMQQENQQQNQSEGDEQQSGENQKQEQAEEQNSGQSSADKQDTGSGQSSNSGSTDPGELLDRQQEITRRTEQGEGSDSNLAQQQKELQNETSGAAGSSSETSQQLEKAASEQEEAVKALAQGDRAEAIEHQKAAEQALAQAAAMNEQQGEAEDILDMESEYEAMKNRLDKTGGIRNADKDW